MSLWECKMTKPLSLQNFLAISYKTKHPLTIYLALLFLNIYPREMKTHVHTMTWMQIFIAALFIMAKTRDSPSVLSRVLLKLAGSCHGTLLSSEKESTLHAGNLESSQGNYAQWGRRRNPSQRLHMVGFNTLEINKLQIWKTELVGLIIPKPMTDWVSFWRLLCLFRLCGGFIRASLCAS